MNIIVDIHNNYRMHSFLKALEETIIVKKHYNYVFANFVSSFTNILRFCSPKHLFWIRRTADEYSALHVSHR